jgi:hypothetical protein
MFTVDTSNLKYAFIKHDHSERAEGHARRNLDLVHVVDLEVSGLFDPILEERISQRMFGFRFR